MKSILTNPLVKSSNYAYSVLDQCETPSLAPLGGLVDSRIDELLAPESNGTYTKLIVDVHSMAENFNEVSRAFWIAFGAMLGSLQNADRVVRETDESRPTPRVWLDTSDSAGDRLLDALQRAERDLNEATGRPFLAEELVTRLKDTIEDLVETTFDLGPTDQRGRRVVSFLSEKCRLRLGNQIELRFAGIALTLYVNYRISDSHNYRHFRCSLEEARFFLAGIRALWTLSEEIRQGKRQPAGGRDSTQ